MSTTVSIALLLALPLPAAADPGDGATSAEQRAGSWRRHLELERSSPFRELEWRPIGPRNAGGRIETIAVHPSRPSTFYVGAGAGNLWKTTDNGLTWTPIFEKESTFAMGELAIAPSDPDVLYLGTGEVLMARSSYAGTGVFRSTDAGASWNHVGLADSHHIARVVVDPRDAQTVWVASLGHNFSDGGERGLYRTKDGGATWGLALSPGDGVGVVDVELTPGDPDTVYAAAWQRNRRAWGHEAYAAANGVYRSNDGGASWQRLGGGLPDSDQVGRIALAVAPSNPDVVYALITLDGRRPLGPRGELWRSDDRGDSWVLKKGMIPSAGYDFCLLEVAADDEDELWIPLQKLWHSTDGGETTVEVKGTIVHLLEHGARRLHLDTHCLWIDPADPAHVIIGNDGGLYTTWDRGGAWLHVNNLPVTEFYALFLDDAQPFNVYGGTQDNAAVFGPIDHVPADGESDPWRSVYLDPWGGGDSFYTPVDPLDPNIVFYSHQFGDLRRKNMRTGETVPAHPRGEKSRPRYRRNWQTPILFSKHDPAVMYYAAHRLLKSTDRGDSWTPISPDLSTDPGPELQGNVPFGTISTIAESPVSAELIWAGTDDGNVQVTIDEGQTWKRKGADLPPKWVTRVTPSAFRRETVYVAQSGYVEDDFAAYLFRSDDLGASWSSIAGNLPAESVNAIVEDPTDERILYVGTDLGVYASIDRGESWHSLCATLPTTPVRDLLVHPRDAVLVIGTHGRSAWALTVAAIRQAAQG